MPKRLSPWVLIFLPVLMLACFLSTGYQRRGGSYVFATSDEGRGYLEHPIVGIDPATFQVLDKNGYARDAGRVYYHENTVEGADPGSFVALTELYGKDNAHVYYQGRELPGADPASFSVFNIQWGKDSRDVYFQDKPLEACDPATFVLLEDDWQRDDKCAYRMTSHLPGADPASFVVLNYWFAKDKDHVYNNLPVLIEGADAATFRIRAGICEVCAEDKNSCYRYEEPVACSSLP